MSTRIGLTVAALRTFTLDRAQMWHDNGMMNDDEWEGWRHAWATSAPRFTSQGAWERHEFATTEAERIATELGCCSHKS